MISLVHSHESWKPDTGQILGISHIQYIPSFNLNFIKSNKKKFLSDI